MDLAVKHAYAPAEQPRPSKKPRLPLALRVTQWVYPRLEKIAPTAAHNWFVDLFFSPPRYKIPSHEQKILKRARHFTVSVRGHEVRCYSWGDGPAVLMVHGWAGRASQFNDFVNHFVNAGYRAISFDAVAHGNTKGKETTIIDFKDAILEIEKKVGKFEAVIGHSLGGAAGVYALTEGLQTNTLITIATPTLGDEIIQEFASRLNASIRAEQHLKGAIKKKLNRTFNEFMASHFIKKVTADINLLVIHDEHDKEASLKNAECLLELYPKAAFHMTTGLGHVRILRDEAVLMRCHAFIEGRS